MAVDQGEGIPLALDERPVQERALPLRGRVAHLQMDHVDMDLATRFWSRHKYNTHMFTLWDDHVKHEDVK